MAVELECEHKNSFEFKLLFSANSTLKQAIFHSNFENLLPLFIDS